MPPRPKPAQHLLNLELLFNRLKNKVGLQDAQFKLPTTYRQVGPMQRYPDGSTGYQHENVGPFSPRPDEGNYIPRGAADQSTNELLFNPDNQGTGLHDSKSNHQYDRFVVSHELGHLAAQRNLNPSKVAQYLQITGQRSAPGAGVGGGGLPLSGEGQTTHQSPNERYANDFAAALGFRYGKPNSLSAGAHGKILRLLVSHGLLPRR